MQLAQGWQQCGDEVTIVTAGYSHRRGKNLTVEKEMEEQQLEGVTFCPLLSPDYVHGVGSTAKSVQSFLKKLYLNAPKLVERYHPEIVIAASGYPYDYFCAQRIAKLAHAKTVFELRETWPELQRELLPRGGQSPQSVHRGVCHGLCGCAGPIPWSPSCKRGEDYCRQKEITPAHLATLPAPAPPQASPPHPCGKPMLKLSGSAGALSRHCRLRRAPQ